MEQQHTCKNCGNVFSGKFCNACGEKKYSLHDKSIASFFKEGLHFITHFEGTLFTSLKMMFTKPGRLALDYCNGIRKKYFKPLSLFLLIVILYLFFPFFEGLNMPLKSYPSQKYYGNYAQQKIEKKLTQTGWNIEKLSDKFHAKSEKASKFLLIIIVPFSALVFFAFAFLKRRYFFEHMIFSAEINSFYLLWGFLILPLILTLFTGITRILNFNIGSFLTETLISVLVYVPVLIYTSIAARSFYSFKWWQTIIFVSVFLVLHSFIVYNLYKFLLFVITINQIH